VADHYEEDEIGYGKPPKRTRFKKGQSGNPTGRPKASKNVASIVSQVCLRRVRVKSEDGKNYSMPIMEAVMTRLTNSAAKGDIRAARVCFDIVKMFPTVMEPALAAPPSILVRFVDGKQGEPIREDPNEKRTILPIEEWRKRKSENPD
jgi:Family of unknown function (DUF5681)